MNHMYKWSIWGTSLCDLSAGLSKLRIYISNISFNRLVSACLKRLLTSLHCFVFLLIFSSSTSNLVVSLGRQTQEGSNPNAVSRSVSRIINHPDYNPSTNDNDISLLRLSSPVTFNSFILPVCLAASDSNFNAGVDTWVTGWGTIGSGGGSHVVFRDSVTIIVARAAFSQTHECIWVSDIICTITHHIT